MNNFLKAVFFDHPDYIPVNFCISGACWHHYPKEVLWELMESHTALFPGFERPGKDWEPWIAPCQHKGIPYTDPMGCVWETYDDGITGLVTGHPLADLSAFGTTWHFPDPDKCDGLYDVDWSEREAHWARCVREGEGFTGGLRHGHTFMQLCDLMGYENFLYAMADEDERLIRLIDGLTEFNLSIVKRHVDNGCTLFGYPEDLGCQTGPMISPALFNKYIKPAYKRLMEPARKAGTAVQMHSDGDIRLLADDLIDSGVQCINLQDLVNGIDWIADKYKGKVCVELDIDRQRITPSGTPAQIDALIKEEVEKLACPDGGLALVYGLYPGVPIENIKALMDALEKYMFCY